jgi:hypothetical protein
MKTILTFAFVAFLAVTTSAVATDVHPSYTKSTATSCFSFFRVHRQHNGATMTWAVNHTGISGFKIERSEDGLNFVEVATDLPCNGTSQHRFTDDEVSPGLILYRITALADGTAVESAEETIRIRRK